LIPLKIAVIGSGISGLSCAWALSQKHHVTLIEQDNRLGGHTNTFSVTQPDGSFLGVDTGFIVHNPAAYPNFVGLLDYLDVDYVETDMTFAVSLREGGFEYNGNNLVSLLGRTKQWFSPTHWRLVYDLVRFYKTSLGHAEGNTQNLGDYLKSQNYSAAFINQHILPIAAAIWSSSTGNLAKYPFAAFIRFFANHNLFELGNRAPWRTVKGGSKTYVDRLVADAKFGVKLSHPVASVERQFDHNIVIAADGTREAYDHVVFATHADQALQLLAEPTTEEENLLRHFKTSANRALLHSDAALMPKRKRFWAAWNYMGGRAQEVSVTYWMNALQRLNCKTDYFVSLNPLTEPKNIIAEFNYRHPIFTLQTLEAQKKLWSLQGKQNTWFCGAWFGAGFHEDGLQAGLAVAEQLGAVRRPWNVANESGRITITDARPDFTNSLAQAAD
jgi:predicted NAD/FAD-binding protein